MQVPPSCVGVNAEAPAGLWREREDWGPGTAHSPQLLHRKQRSVGESCLPSAPGSPALHFWTAHLVNPREAEEKELAGSGKEGIVLNSQDSSPSTIIKGVGIGKKWRVLFPLKWGAWKKRLPFQTFSIGLLATQGQPYWESIFHLLEETYRHRGLTAPPKTHSVKTHSVISSWNQWDYKSSIITLKQTGQRTKITAT